MSTQVEPKMPGPAAVENRSATVLPVEEGVWPTRYTFDAEGRVVGVVEQLGPGSIRFFPMVSPIGGDESDALDELAEILAPEFMAVLLQIGLDTKQTPKDVLRKAIGLYKLAVDARRAGQRIAIVDQDWQVDREITGY